MAGGSGPTRSAGGGPRDGPGHHDDPDRWEHADARVNGIDLHYVRVDPDPAAVDGATEPPLVLLLHGFPECWYAWRNQLTALADAGYRVVAPDLRGYNRSSAPDGVDAYRMPELVADVRGLVGSLGYARAHLVGHDWGGVVAWETAIREPELVGRLAVLNAPHPEPLRRALTRSPRQLLRSWYAVAFQVPWLPDRLLAAGEYRLLDRAFAGAAPGAVTDRDVERYRTALARSGPTGPLNYYRAALREGLGRQARSLVGDPPDGTVEVPTLVLWGVRDRALGTELLDGLERYVPDLRIERLDASHWVMADEPERVNDLLTGFL